MAISDTIEKIRKLLSLATSSNPHEAALALDRARKMMEEHGISQDDLDLTSIGESFSDFVFSAVMRPPAWMAYLAGVVATQFGVSYYLDGEAKRLKFIGVDHKAQIASYVMTVIGRQLRRARTDFLRSQSKRLKRQTKIARADSFAEGYIFSVKRLMTPLSTSPKERALIAKYMEKLNLAAVPSRGAKENRGTDEARFSGVKAGNSARLHHGMAGDAHQGVGHTLQIGAQ